MSTDVVQQAGEDLSQDLKDRIRDFWNQNPCGSDTSSAEQSSTRFFDEVERHRYAQEPHIPEFAEFERWRHRDVLEIGIGMGTDSVQFARCGARLTGIDLTRRAVEITTQRFARAGLAGRFEVADAEQLPFGDESFDLVYSYGVLHHTPDTQRAIDEVCRVLKSGGQARVMLYHRNSFRYLIDMMLIRRAAYALLRAGLPPVVLARLTRFRRESLERYAITLRSLQRLGSQEVLNNATDGPGNPLSKVYSRREGESLFRGFSRVESYVRYLVKQNIPFIGRYLPEGVDQWLGARFGASLFLIATK